MTRRVVLLSGHIAAGKSTLAESLVERYGASLIKTRELIERVAEERDIATDNRAAMQDLGERLDTETGGGWVGEAVSRFIAGLPEGSLVVIDGVRIAGQIESVRDAVSGRVDHVHLQASPAELAARFVARGDTDATFAEAQSNATESAVDGLAQDADITIDTDRCDKEDVLIRCAARLGLLRDEGGYVDVLVGGEYGSEGKGNIAFYLAPEYDVLVRVGGANAGHTVPFGDEPYTHRLLPSGTRANPTATLLLGAGSVLKLDVLRKEMADCEVEPGNLGIDPQAMVVEEWDVDQEEMSVKGGIGSTGSGTGLATARRIARRGDTPPPALEDTPPVRLARDVKELEPYIRPVAEELADAFRSGRRVLLEGTQGTMLSLYHGEYPYVTSRDTTVNGCLAEAGIGPGRVRRVVLVTRTYPIRVMSPVDGTSGDMKGEITWETVSERSGIPVETLREEQHSSVTKKLRRVSEFDWALLRRSIELNTATDVALTFADHLNVSNQDARRFDQLDAATVRFVEEVESVGGAPVSLISTRFAKRSIIDRRRW
jgi:adenylosuccinate synthase